MFAGRYFGGRFFGRRFFGKTGLLVDGAYNGARYFSPRYFAVRYFGVSAVDIPQPLAATNTPALSGVLGVAGNLVFGANFALAQTGSLGLSATLSLSGGALSFDNETWAFTPPLSVSGMTGTVTVAGALVYAGTAPGYGGFFGRRYFGARHFGPRFFGSQASWVFTQTGSLSLSGVVGVSGQLDTSIAFNTSTLALTGALATAGDFLGGLVSAPTPPSVGSNRRRLPSWAKQPGRPSPPIDNPLVQAADDDQRLLDLVQALYDGGAFNQPPS
jgi:hypothetical protein